VSRYLLELALVGKVGRCLDNNNQLGSVLKNDYCGQYDSVLALVDPYKIANEADAFVGWMEAIPLAAKPGAPVVVLVFRHGDFGWPPSFNSVKCVGTYDRDPYG